MISAGLGPEIMELSFVGGLMRDLGKVVMNNETLDEFSEVMMKIYNEDIDSITAETEVYGYNHEKIGAGVLEKWGFAAAPVDVLKYHHLNNVMLSEFKNPAVAKTVAAVHLADNVCKVLAIGHRNPTAKIELHKLPSAFFLKLNRDRIDILLKNIEETYNAEKAIFA